MLYAMFQQLKQHALIANVAGMLGALAIAMALFAPEKASLTHADDRQPDPTPTVDDAFQPDSFPVTPAMTDTIQLVLDQYLGRQAIALQTIDDQGFTTLSTRSSVYLPLMRRSAAPSNPTPTPRPRPPERADIAVTIWPEPSIYVMRGGRLTYELRLTNYDVGSAEGVRVTLPYDRSQMRPIASRLDPNKGDWVSRLTDREVEVTFGSLDSKAGRSGLLVFEVATTLGNDTLLNMRPSYTWWDDQEGYGPYRSNWAPVLIGNGPATAPWVWTEVTPISGAPGTIHTFFSNRFAPGEGIITWLNTPGGVRALDLRGIVDSQGAVTLAFSSAGLSPGSYQMVLYGARSQLTGIATFIVR
jgi:hypothetical protein